MVLALQGGMAVGKTTAARYVAAHDPAAVSYTHLTLPTT